MKSVLYEDHIAEIKKKKKLYRAAEHVESLIRDQDQDRPQLEQNCECYEYELGEKNIRALFAERRIMIIKKFALENATAKVLCTCIASARLDR